MVNRQVEDFGGNRTYAWEELNSSILADGADYRILILPQKGPLATADESRHGTAEQVVMHPVMMTQGNVV